MKKLQHPPPREVLQFIINQILGLVQQKFAGIHVTGPADLVGKAFGVSGQLYIPAAADFQHDSAGILAVYVHITAAADGAVDDICRSGVDIDIACSGNPQVEIVAGYGISIEIAGAADAEREVASRDQAALDRAVAGAADLDLPKVRRAHDQDAAFAGDQRNVAPLAYHQRTVDDFDIIIFQKVFLGVKDHIFGALRIYDVHGSVDDDAVETVNVVGLLGHFAVPTYNFLIEYQRARNAHYKSEQEY